MNRAHHADVGGKTPGSMPGSSSTLDEEGIVIPPTLFVTQGAISEDVLRVFQKETRNPDERIGDLNAQKPGRADRGFECSGGRQPPWGIQVHRFYPSLRRDGF
ncbi:MAG: hydantoinase B/oxoprolinase family protein [Deltaproteobacteria bacterium]|nr:hydantoinase B/oxoprolinase family protein [Deltaproteobacteria bacterium]